MDRRNYSQIRADLAAANEWLASLGVREQQDRIRQNMRRIERLEEAWQAGKVVQATQGEEGRLVVFSLTEAIEFLDVYEAFSPGNPAELPQRIKQALDGPVDLGDESPKSSRGRNIMFELNLASRLHLRGVEVDLPRANPDILTRLVDVPIYIQCKRPYKEDSVPGNIESAASQLKRDLDQAGDPNARGIIAISVSRAFNSGDQVLAGCDEETVKNRLGDDVQRLGKSQRRTWSAVIHPQICGILFHLITPAHIQNINLLTVAQQTVIFSLPHCQQADVDLLRNVANVIGNS